ncbi:hypothetical protein [Paraburkholderia phenazinium]|jgi:N-ethylmaleimide reductase|uniref:hypothetical protein n=1 Tax=Paraburkholderia phenazinium TaxID=60549 RepID=UPI001557D349|nr:hypothetical protein [Paraburkholderia phenazinium]
MNLNGLGRGQSPVASSFLRKFFKGPIMAAGGFDREGAEDILQRGDERSYFDFLPSAA